ncbi:precorrin-3B synthase [Prauserella rugosa]|uniref:Precorrin-3B synthase n=2 Tax=Prauserella rugosa TaxID=43354 RepID=A0A660CGT5_9PSEU|nr:precorrin-3B synthase [Prauserella rugosa]
MRADACPGVLATHEAADGPLARIRLPGGALSPEQAVAVAACAAELGDGRIHLTSRANLQLRAVRDVDALVTRLSAAGLLPSPARERIRNILGSPLSGVHGGVADVRDLVRDLDHALCASADLTGLPGRFLFALDDGRGDVAPDADLCWHAVTSDTGALLTAGADTGLRVPRGRAVAALVAGARAFEESRGAAWRLRELDPAPVVDAMRTEATAEQTPEPAPTEPAPTEPAQGEPRPVPFVGPVDGRDDVVVVAPRLGELTADTLRGLGGAGSALTVTPWRTVVVHDTSAAALAGRYSDLVVDPADPLLGVSACIGAPHCAKSHADVRGDATAVTAELARRGLPGAVAHFAGCSRRCGRPGGSHIDVVAAEGGYHVGGTFVGLDRVAEALSAQAHDRTTREGQQ